MPSPKNPNQGFFALLSAACFKKSQQQEKKIRKIKEKTSENVSTQNYTQMFNRKPVAGNLELASLYFDVQSKEHFQGRTGKGSASATC